MMSGMLLLSGRGRICCTEEMCYGFAVGSSDLNLGSGNFKVMTYVQTGLCNEVCRVIQLEDEGILILEVTSCGPH